MERRLETVTLVIIIGKVKVHIEADPGPTHGR
jgi:hypothetical protein